MKTLTRNSDVITSFNIRTAPRVIDGSTQPGYAGIPLIELNGRVAVARAMVLPFCCQIVERQS
jgi:hypothetical protein